MENSYSKLDIIDGYIREFDRLITGEYLDLPPAVYRKLAEYGVNIEPLHFIHASTDKPGMVAYTENERGAAQDRQVRTKFGKYLAKYHASTLDTPKIAELSALLRGKVQTNDVQWATTREDIREVYEEGPRSCMSYRASTYECFPYHPTEVYASEDCAVAYLVRDGRITARTVCNMLDKEYTTFYGDAEVLRDLLQDAGFKHGSLDGCRLLLLECNEGIVLPYLDGTNGVDNCGTYLRCGGSDYEGCETNGLAEQRIVAHCEHCGDAIFDDEDCHSAYDGNEIVCAGCADWHYRYSDSMETLVNNDDEEHVSLPDGQFVLYADLGEYGYCILTDCGEVTPLEDCVELDNGDFILADEAVWCQFDGCWAHTDDATEYETSNDETRYTVGDPLDDPDNVAHEEENDAA